MSEAKLAVFDDLVGMTENPLRPIMRALRELILEIDSEACEVVRLGERAASYGVGPRKMKEGYVYILPHKSWVNLGFFLGSDLKDPKNLLEGTGAKMRHVKIRSIEDVERPAILSLVNEAIKQRKKSLDL